MNDIRAWLSEELSKRKKQMIQFSLIISSSRRQRLGSSEVLWVQDTVHVSLLDPLHRQGSDQSSTNTASVLGGENLDRIIFLGVRLLRPVQDLTKCLRATSLEVGILVENGSISTNVALLISFLLADGSNAAGGEASGAGTD